MTFTVAFILIGIGIAIGYRLPGPVGRLKAAYRRRFRKPTLLRAASLDTGEVAGTPPGNA